MKKLLVNRHEMNVFCKICTYKHSAKFVQIGVANQIHCQQ